jgi:hypothetical protein
MNPTEVTETLRRANMTSLASDTAPVGATPGSPATLSPPADQSTEAANAAEGRGPAQAASEKSEGGDGTHLQPHQGGGAMEVATVSLQAHATSVPARKVACRAPPPACLPACLHACVPACVPFGPYD